LNSSDSTLQFLWLIAALFAFVIALEFFVAWLVKRWRSPLFWPIGFLTGILVLLLQTGWPIQPEHLTGTTLAVTSGVFVLWSLSAFVWRGRGFNPTILLAPAIVLMSLLIVYPFCFQIELSFSNLNTFSIAKWLRDGSLNFVGFQNYANVFASDVEGGGWQSIVASPFWQLLWRTIVWTSVNVIFHVVGGMFLAMLLNQDIRGKAIYRTFLIVPWAMPQVVAVLAWRGEFHPEFGAINQLIQMFGFDAVQWWSDPSAVFVSCCVVNIWLGIPFMMIVFLGGLGSIPKSYYEAASIDGAGVFRQFFSITMPMLKPVVVPSVTLGTIWTFNNVNVIYLMTGQDGGTESADILVSALYKAAFTYSRFSYAAAFAVVVFMLLTAFTLGWFRLTKEAES
jgi:arabinogalactan oligomer/maltooligosaccharide transport system permease protein